MGKLLEDPALRNKSGVFRDRCDAGKRLAQFIQREITPKNAVICAIPSGGIPVGVEIASGLSFPFTVLVVRKLQIPWNTEAGFGSMTWDGTVYLNQALVDRLSLSDDDITRAVEKTADSIRDRTTLYSGYMKSLVRVTGKTVIITDDGLASGYTMLAAVRSLRRLDPGQVIVAIPTGSVAAATLLSAETDIVVCLNLVKGPAFAVAAAYQNWHDLSDLEVNTHLFRIKETGIF
ncbi:MAG TPA: phosphoribosyltransferase family protein [Methanoregulaceae archaeon]|nr:phosphoribosyltransferase family protein [Methanoregulaceae archaeon]